MFETSTPKWRSRVLFCLHTGQRLMDEAPLTWGQVGTRCNEVDFITGKTGRRMALTSSSESAARESIGHNSASVNRGYGRMVLRGSVYPPESRDLCAEA